MKRKLLIFVVVVALFALFGFLFRQLAVVDQLVEYESRLRALLDDYAVRGFLIGFGVYFLLSLIPGTGGKAIIAGWLFGFWPAVILVDVALTAAAILTFLISRYLLRDVLREKYASFMERLDRAVSEDGAYYLFALRMMHVPYTPTNYAMGTTSLDLKSFWWATQLGLIPGTMVFVLAGTQLPTLATVAEQGTWSFLSLEVLAALALTGVAPLIFRWAVRRYWPREQTPELPDSPEGS